MNLGRALYNLYNLSCNLKNFGLVGPLVPIVVPDCIEQSFQNRTKSIIWSDEQKLNSVIYDYNDEEFDEDWETITDSLPEWNENNQNFQQKPKGSLVGSLITSASQQISSLFKTIGGE